MKLIAFTGAAGAGKDTACAELVTRYKHCQVLSFALPIYEHLAATTGYSVRQILVRKRDQANRWREALERAGDEIRARDGERALILDMEHRLAGIAANRPQDLVLINDLRTAAEQAWVREQSHSLLIHIHRPDGVSRSEHHTNQPLPVLSGDALVINDDDTAKLRMKVRQTVVAWLNALEVA